MNGSRALMQIIRSEFSSSHWVMPLLNFAAASVALAAWRAVGIGSHRTRERGSEGLASYPVVHWLASHFPFFEMLDVAKPQLAAVERGTIDQRLCRPHWQSHRPLWGERVN